MQLKKKSDGSAVQTETWNFGKKAYYPTTMTQHEGTGEVDLPGRYTYDIGPARPSGTAPFYERQTILEWFDNWSIGNIAPEDIREAYRKHTSDVDRGDHHALHRRLRRQQRHVHGERQRPGRRPARRSP